MFRTWAVAAGVCVSIASASIALVAQQPSSQQPSFRGGTLVVPVDVVVVDKDGKHVYGLQASDFAVFDRRTRQSIAVFTEVNDSTAPVAPAADRVNGVPQRAPARHDVVSNQITAPDRLVVMVVDDLHIFHERTDKAKDLARRVLTTLGPPSAMAVLFTSGDHNTVVTRDAAELLAAIDTTKGRRSIRRPAQAEDVQRPGFLDPEAPAEVNIAALEKANRKDLHDFMDNLTEFKTLQDASRLLSGEDVRRKVFVLISEGLAFDATGIFDNGGPGLLQATGADDGGIPQPQGQQGLPKVGYHANALREMMAAMWRAHVVTYSLDPRGHIAPQDLGRESFPDLRSGLGDDPGLNGFRWNNPVRMAQDGLSIMSDASGGFAVTDTDDYANGIARIAEDVGHYYLLGFAPTDPTGRGSRPLDVRIPAHPEWKLRFRKSYEEEAVKASAAPIDPRAELAKGVLPKSSLALTAFAAALPASGRDARVTTMLGLKESRTALAKPDGRLADDITYAVFAVDTRTSKMVQNVGNTATLRSSTASRASAGDDVAFQIPIELTLPPGQYQLRFTATSQSTRAGGSVYLTMDVPDFTAKKLTMSGLVLGYANGAHQPIAQAPPGLRPPGTYRPSPLPLVPSLDRSYAASEVLRIYAEFTRGRSNMPVQASVDIVDDAGHAAVHSAHAIPATASRLDLTCPLAGLARGNYRLHVTISDGVATVERDVAFAVK